MLSKFLSKLKSVFTGDSNTEKDWDKRRAELLKSVNKEKKAHTPTESRDTDSKNINKNKRDYNKKNYRERPNKNKSGRYNKQGRNTPNDKQQKSDDLKKDNQQIPATQGKSNPQQSGEKKSAPQNKRRRVERENLPKWNPEEYQVPVEEGKTRFQDLKLANPIMHAIADMKFQYCTPIQAEILPHSLTGKDSIGQAQTGTGKTAAFLITILSRLMVRRPKGKREFSSPRSLIMAPTRELAIQIAKDAYKLCKYLPFKVVAVYGGMDYKKQQRALDKKYVDILIATPGRLLDFQKQKKVDLSRVEILVVDEADRMLDMGFMPDMRKIVYSTPHKSNRQTLLFSATFPDTVQRMTDSWTVDPARVTIAPENVAVDTVDQKVYITTSEEKMVMLYNTIKNKNLSKVIIFANRRDEAKRIENELFRLGLKCAVISGDVDQRKRLKTLDAFKSGEIEILVATDVASRGLHIDGISHVINYSLPEDPEDYVHRIGRTGRAGATGISVSFATEDDSFQLPAIEKFIGKPFEYEYPTDEDLKALPEHIKQSKYKEFYDKNFVGTEPEVKEEEKQSNTSEEKPEAKQEEKKDENKKEENDSVKHNKNRNNNNRSRTNRRPRRRPQNNENKSEAVNENKTSEETKENTEKKENSEENKTQRRKPYSRDKRRPYRRERFNKKNDNTEAESTGEKKDEERKKKKPYSKPRGNRKEEKNNEITLPSELSGGISTSAVDSDLLKSLDEAIANPEKIKFSGDSKDSDKE